MPKKGEAWTVCWFKEQGIWQERRGGIFWGREGVDTSMHTMYGTWKSKGIKFKLTQPLYLRSGFNFTIIYPFKSSGIEKILHIFCCFNENITNITLNFCKLPSSMHFCYFRNIIILVVNIFSISFKSYNSSRIGSKLILLKAAWHDILNLESCLWHVSHT